jgi:hypothetical protein
MTEGPDGNDADQAREWVHAVLTLQNQISAKLKAVGFLKPGDDDRISHHLAEATFGGSLLASRMMPLFLTCEGQDLSNAAVDLVEDVREIREAIDTVEEELTRLMNYLNK